MPGSLHNEIARKFDGEQAKRKLFTTWLAGHPCPTWDHVERLLSGLESRGKGREGAAEEVKETYLKSELPFHLILPGTCTVRTCIHLLYMYIYMYTVHIDCTCTCIHLYTYCTFVMYLYMYVENHGFRSTQGNRFL